MPAFSRLGLSLMSLTVISRLLLLMASLAVALAMGGSAWGQEPEPQAVQDAREALGGPTSFPWYDRQEDSARPIRLRENEDDSANRASNWQNKRTATRTTPTGNVSYFGTILQVLGLLVLVSVLVLVAVLIARAFMRNEVTETAGSRVVETSQDVDRVEHLPFHLRRPAGDLLSEARRLYEAGDYSQAVLYLYSHLLVQLDRQHVIRLAKGKTNRQYLLETRPRPVLHQILETTMVSFEDVFFGHHKLSREQFEASWNRLPEFEAELTQVERAAA